MFNYIGISDALLGDRLGQVCDVQALACDFSFLLMGPPPLLGSGLQRPPALCDCSMASGYGLPIVILVYYHYGTLAYTAMLSTWASSDAPAGEHAAMYMFRGRHAQGSLAAREAHQHASPTET